MKILNVVKRPIPVQAVQWTGSNFPEIKEFTGQKARLSEYESEAIFVDSLEGSVRGTIGDYIMRGIKGEFYICEKSIFEESYRSADIEPEYVFKGRNIEEVITDLILSKLGLKKSLDNANWYEIIYSDLIHQKFLLIVESGAEFDGHRLRKGFSLGVCNLAHDVSHFPMKKGDKLIPYALLSDPDGFFISLVEPL